MTLVALQAPVIATENAAAGARRQLTNVRTELVHESSGSHLLRFAGRIGVDEERQYRLIAAADLITPEDDR